MIIVAAPVMILFLMLAFFRRNGQNFEQLLIAIVGFVANTRRRVWRKDNIVETFRVEAMPAVVEQSQRNPAEVRSELERIATLIDSRGWNQPTAEYTEATVPEARLIMPRPLLDEAQAEVKPVRDMLDLEHSPLAQNLAGLIQTATSDMRREAIINMHHTAVGAPVAAPEPLPAPALEPAPEPAITPAAPAPASVQPTAAPEPRPLAPASIPLIPTEVTNALPTDILKSSAGAETNAAAAPTPAPTPASTQLIPNQSINLRQNGN
jgi:hypothetical protein